VGRGVLVRKSRMLTETHRCGCPEELWCILPLLLFLLSSAVALRGQEGGPAPGRILFGSCLDPRKPHPVLSTIVGFEPDLFIFLGDNVYADTENRAQMARRYRELAESPRFQTLRRACPVMAVWDDHDYGKNDAGAGFPAKEMSRELFLDFWQVPDDSPRRDHEGVYHAALLGPQERRVQIILLDTRYFRSPLKRGSPASPANGPYVPLTGPEVTLLGEEQWRWLEEQLRVPARLRLIASSIQVLTEPHGWESWANFPGEQKRLLNLLKKTGAEGVLFISGDRHFGELSVLEQDDFYTLYDLTSSGLNRRFPARRPNENRRRVGDYFLYENFGMISVDWGAPDPVLTLGLFDVAGNEVLRRELFLSALAR
jgi:alkaline phosphatase D